MSSFSFLLTYSLLTLGIFMELNPSLSCFNPLSSPSLLDFQYQVLSDYSIQKRSVHFKFFSIVEIVFSGNVSELFSMFTFPKQGSCIFNDDV